MTLNMDFKLQNCFIISLISQIIIFNISKVCNCLDVVQLKAVMPVKYEVKAGDILQLTLANIPVNTQFVLFQAHSQIAPVNISLKPYWQHGISVSGSSVGIIAQYQTPTCYVNVTQNSTLLLVAIPHTFTDPMPGGCNMEFPLLDDPNIYIDSHRSVNVVKFAYANHARKRGQPEPDCEDGQLQSELQYELYARFLPTGDTSEATFLDVMQNVITVADVTENATRVHGFAYGSGVTRSLLAAYPGQGVIYTVVVEQTNRSTGQSIYAAYTPASTYDCTFTGDCHINVSTLVHVLLGVLAVLGIWLCFLGHRHITAEMMFFGFLMFFILAALLFNRYSTLRDEVLVGVVCSCGIAGGVLWLCLWLFWGLPVVMVLVPGFTFGYILTAYIFSYTPLGRLDMFMSGSSYGMTYACGVLLITVILLPSPKTLNMVCCAGVGSFLPVFFLATHIHSSMTYPLLNSLHKSSISSFINARTLTPYQSNDIFLSCFWVSLFILGLSTQLYINHGRPAFPPCPYQRYKQNKTRRQLDDILPDSYSGGYGVNERTPLIRYIQRPPPYRDEPLIQPL